MLEILGEDRERIEELHREIKKEQERIAIRSLIATQKALMMLELSLIHIYTKHYWSSVP